MTKLLFTLKKMLRFGRSNSELDEEIRFHFDMSVEQKMANGLSKEEAETEARKDFGREMYAKEACRMSWGARLWDETVQDIQFAVRRLWKNKNYSLPIILILAICMGTCVTFFNIVDKHILNPLPYPKADEIIEIAERHHSKAYKDINFRINGVSYEHIAQLTDTFQSIGAFSPESKFLYRDGKSESIRIAKAFPSIWEVLQVKPGWGRLFTDNDIIEKNEKIAIVSYLFAKKHFGSAQLALKEEIRLNEDSFKIIGILSKDTLIPDNYSICIPTDNQFNGLTSDEKRSFSCETICRLKAGVSIEQLDSRLATARETAIASNKRMERLFSHFDIQYKSRQFSFQEKSAKLDYKMIVIILFSLTILLYLITCSNWISILQTNLIRSLREITICSSLGASRTRIVKQYSVENIILFTAAAILSTFVVGIIQYKTNKLELFESNPLTFEYTDFVATLFLLVTGSVLGLPIILQKTRGNKMEKGLHERQSTISTRSKGILLSNIVQSFLTVVLLLCSLFLTLNVTRILTADFGFDYENRIVSEIQFPNWKFEDSHNDKISILKNIESMVTRYPIFKSHSFATALPQSLLDYPGTTVSMGYDSFPQAPTNQSELSVHKMSIVGADPSFNHCLRLNLIKGRWLSAKDASTPELEVVIEKSLASELFGEMNPIDYSFSFGFKNAKEKLNLRIVGIIDNINFRGNQELVQKGQKRLYFSIYEDHFLLSLPDRYVLIAEVEHSKRELLDSFEKTIRQIDPDLGIKMHLYSESIKAKYSWMVLARNVSITLSSITLIIGIYGFFSYFYFRTNLQKKELAIRLSLGEPFRSLVLKYTLKHSIPVLIGTLMGCGTTYFLFKQLDSHFTEITQNDPIPYLIAVGIMLTIVIVASIIPFKQISKFSLRETLSYD